MSLSYGLTVKVGAADIVCAAAASGPPRPPLSVIPSSASRPSYKGWAFGGCRRARARASSRPGVFPPILLTRGRTTNQRYLVDNGNNMQSVKISIVIGDNVEDYSIKGIFNDICLTSNVSVILCVPHLMNKDNCYSDIDTVTEPMQCTNCSTPVMVVDTNNIGACKRVDEDESQRFNDVKKLESNMYSIVFVDSILSNQMIGETPNYCIPVKINAITVQGISYGDPHSSSFNLNSNMASTASRSTNKSDYAFKTSVCIMKEESRKRNTEPDDASHKGDIVNKHPDTETSSNGNSQYDGDYQNRNTEGSVVRGETSAGMSLVAAANTEKRLGTALSFDEMLACIARERAVSRALVSCDGADSWGVPHRLRLRGGGESSVSNASGWGSPPTSNNNAAGGNWGGAANGQAAGGNPQQQWSGAGQRPPTSQPDMNSNKSGSNGAPPSSAAAAGGGGWPGAAGGLPATPNNNALPPANNGTAQSPGGNSGGNSSPNGSSNGNISGAAGSAANSIASSTKIEQLNSMREALYSQDGWGGQHVNQDTNWDVPGSPEPGVKLDPTAAGAPPAWKPNINNGTDLWEANLRNGGQPASQPTPKTPWGHTPTTNIGGTWGEDDDIDTPNLWSGPPPPQQWAGAPPQQPQHWGGAAAKKDDWGAWGEPHRPVDPRFEAHRAPEQRPLPPDPRHEHLRADMRGDMRDMRGISGRLNGDMWGQHHPNAPVPNKVMPGAGINQWGAQGPKDPVKGGWEEPSPPVARRSASGFEDGTSLWSGRSGAAGMPGSRGAAQGPPAPQRAPPVQAKPDAVWGQPPQRGNPSWEEGGHAAPGWGERDAPSWPDAGNAGLGWAAPKPKPQGPGGAWPDDIGEWGGPKPPPGGPGKQITKEALWSSKQFRVLVEMGYKKEEVEAALRRCDMNTEEALELLSPMRGGGGGAGGDGWRGRADEHFPLHHGPFPHAPPGALSAVSPAVAHKMLNQPPQPPQHHHHPPYNHPNSGGGGSGGGGGGGGGAGGQPSATQLRMLVQQIQMAVSAGYLNHQILNQPLAPQTLVLLNQLLQQIKGLQQLVTQHSMALNKNNSAVGIHCSVQITKAKQQITNLQNQIAAQQAIYVKQQTGNSELFSKQPPHDPLSQLQNNFSDMGINKEPQPAYGVQAGGNQQSRLTQWKLPSLDKEAEGSEFSRAPGTAKSATSPQLNLALQPDTTWGRSGVGEAWGEVGGADVGDGKDSWPAHLAHQPVYDLVPEFEPGKPWKGHQMKNVEDDPAMTPGSVVRSPLSLAAIKDSDMLGGGGGGGGKASPPAGERSLSSSTWSYPPPAAAAAPLKQPPPDAWAANKTRAPPPGLNKPWPPQQQQQQHHQRNISSWQSTWLLLKNLTAQIDGSTLKTLCMQHGPLLSFHLYLNQGTALARYSSREEANKAQMALNNCVLSNTTIFAESPGESEVQMILQHLGQGGGVGGGGAWRSAAAAAAGKEPAWGFPSLWSEPHEQRSTPSSLNSFLPPDLLGGESI